MKSNYKQLGDLVQWVDERNKTHESTDVLGVSIEKRFMPSVANTIGTDLSSYKLVRKGRFACNPMHVGRDKALPVALCSESKSAIVSPAYFVFEVIDTSEVLPEYLILLFQTSLFDRNCWFRTDGTVRGGISWADLCLVELPVPNIEVQRGIVNSQKALSAHISFYQKEIEKCEAILLALYRNLSKGEHGWQIKTLGEVCDTVGGGTPSTDCPEYYKNGNIPWVTPTDVTKNNCLSLETTRTKITELGLACSSAKMLPPYAILMTSRASVGYFALCSMPVCTNQGFISCIPKKENMRMFLLLNLIDRVEEIRIMAEGGSTYSEISKSDFRALTICEPPDDVLESFERQARIVFRRIQLAKSMCNTLMEAKATILSRTYTIAV